MFHYEVMSAQEANAERFQLLKEGQYEGVITSSTDTTSSKGSPMMDMTVSVYDENGKSHEIRDFLVFTKPMMWKVVHFADSANVSKEYEAGKLCSEVVLNKRVMVKIGIENGGEIPADRLKGKPAGTRYFDKNKIEDYLKKEKHGNAEPFEDDDVPFL
jgi:hypothetical protein